MNTKEKCEHCEQSIYTESSLNKGVAQMLCAMAKYCEDKGINVFHPEKELLQQGYISANMRGNVSHLGNHGLIAKHKEAGNWVLTTKGLKFLNGESVMKIAIVRKATKETVGYVQDQAVTIHDLLNSQDEYWFQPGFTIVEGRVVKEHYKTPRQIAYEKQNETPLFG